MSEVMWRITFQYLRCELFLCELVCKKWQRMLSEASAIVSHSHGVPFACSSSYVKFKTWMANGNTSPHSGVRIELSGIDVLADVFKKTGKDLPNPTLNYIMQRHWTPAPLYEITCMDVHLCHSAFIQIYICLLVPSLMFTDRVGQSAKLLNNVGDFIVIDVVVGETHSQVTCRRTKKIFENNTDPLLATLRCSEKKFGWKNCGTISEAARVEIGNAFAEGWSKLKTNKFETSTDVVLDWKPVPGSAYSSPIGTPMQRHHKLIAEFLCGDEKHLSRPSCGPGVFVKSITLVAKETFLALRFNPPLEYNAYVSAITKTRPMFNPEAVRDSILSR